MAGYDLPSPTMTLSRAHARRFLLAHHCLWPPRQLHGKAGVVDYIGHVGCIQFDPINVVGCNPDLVLQARVRDYRPDLLEGLLYEERVLWDGWDKVSSIHLAADWPHFARHRAAMEAHHAETARSQQAWEAAPDVLDMVRRRGPTSSLDLRHLEEDDGVSWAWGHRARLGKAALDVLYDTGAIGVHHRVANRRVFDVVQNLLSAELLSAPDPNGSEEAYQEWHVLRRVGGLGLANPSAGQCWQGICEVNGRVRRAVLTRLAERGEAVTLALEGVPERVFFVRAADLPTLEAVADRDAPPAEAAFIAPLDNLIWDRDLARWVFDFDYVWEVYKPRAQRRYGYYVLPVLYGDRFVARFEPAFDKNTRELTIANWWWEEGVRPHEAMQAALADCLEAFAGYLDAGRVMLGEAAAGDAALGAVVDRLRR